MNCLQEFSSFAASKGHLYLISSSSSLYEVKMIIQMWEKVVSGEEMLIAFSIVCFIGRQCQMSLRPTLFKFVHVAYMFSAVNLHRWNCPQILFHIRKEEALLFHRNINLSTKAMYHVTFFVTEVRQFSHFLKYVSQR